MSATGSWSRVLALLCLLLAGGCASGFSNTRSSRLITAERSFLLEAITQELQQERIPIEEVSNNEQVRSGTFDPRMYWFEADVAQRVACVAADGQDLAPVGNVLLRITVSAENRGSGPVPEGRIGQLPGHPVAMAQVVLRSQGSVNQGTSKSGRGSCALSEQYANELVERIARRFPAVSPPRRVTTT